MIRNEFGWAEWERGLSPKTLICLEEFHLKKKKLTISSLPKQTEASNATVYSCLRPTPSELASWRGFIHYKNLKPIESHMPIIHWHTHKHKGLSCFHGNRQTWLWSGDYFFLTQVMRIKVSWAQNDDAWHSLVQPCTLATSTYYLTLVMLRNKKFKFYSITLQMQRYSILS